MISTNENLNINKFLSNPTYILIFLVGFISVQRFLFADFYALLCILPIIYFWIKFFLYRKIDASILIIALIMSVDNGADVYTQTPSFIRYVIWITILFSILYKSKLIRSRILIYLFWISPILIITLLNFDLIHLPSLYRDIFLCCMLFIAATKSISKENYYFDVIDMKLLFFFSVGILLAELINTNFHDPSHYSNYSSLKSFIVFPSIYLLSKRNHIAGIILTILTLFVMLSFVTRMIFISYFIILILLFLNNIYFLSFLKKLFVTLFILPVIFFSVTLALNYFEDTTKITALFFMITNNLDGSFVDLLILIDPVRYYELKMLLDSNPVVWIFGNGLGTGYIDENGYFSFLGWHAPSAFSDDELRAGYFYSFHDIWTDIGYRFGVLPTLAFVFWLIIQELQSNDELSSLRFLILTLTLCSFWSVSGVLLILILFIIYRSSVKKNV